MNKKEKKFNIDHDLLEKLYQLHDQDMSDFVNKILRNALMNNQPSNNITLSDKTHYELMKVREMFKNIEIDNKNDELINYALRLIQNINNTKLPGHIK